MLRNTFNWPHRRGPTTGALSISPKETLSETFTLDGHFGVLPVGSCLPAATHEIKVHFSLDMAQQVRRKHLIRCYCLPSNMDVLFNQ